MMCDGQDRLEGVEEALPLVEVLCVNCANLLARRGLATPAQAVRNIEEKRTINGHVYPKLTPSRVVSAASSSIMLRAASTRGSLVEVERISHSMRTVRAPRYICQCKKKLALNQGGFRSCSNAPSSLAALAAVAHSVAISRSSSTQLPDPQQSVLLLLVQRRIPSLA